MHTYTINMHCTATLNVAMKLQCITMASLLFVEAVAAGDLPEAVVCLFDNPMLDGSAPMAVHLLGHYGLPHHV